MTNRWIRVALLSGVMAFPLTWLRADDMPAPTPSTNAKGHSGDDGQWQKKLGLSDDQAAKLKSLRDAEMTAVKPLRDKQKDMMAKLKDQVKNKAADSDIQASLDALQANRKVMMDQMEQFRAQREAILTPTERAKMLLHGMKRFHKEHEDLQG